MSEHFFIHTHANATDGTVIGKCIRPDIGQELFRTWLPEGTPKPNTSLGIVISVEENPSTDYALSIQMNTGKKYFLQRTIT